MIKLGSYRGWAGALCSQKIHGQKGAFFHLGPGVRGGGHVLPVRGGYATYDCNACSNIISWHTMPKCHSLDAIS